MKAFEDPRFEEGNFRALAEDPRLMPMLRQWQQNVIQERSSCDPEDERRYDVLTEMMARVLMEADEQHAKRTYRTMQGGAI